MNTIQKLTAGCDRDCGVEEMGLTSTLVHTPQVFDKHGRPKIADPGISANILTRSYRCHTCGVGWVVRYSNGKDSVVRREPEVVE